MGTSEKDNGRWLGLTVFLTVGIASTLCGLILLSIVQILTGTTKNKLTITQCFWAGTVVLWPAFLLILKDQHKKEITEGWDYDVVGNQLIFTSPPTRKTYVEGQAELVDLPPKDIRVEYKFQKVYLTGEKDMKNKTFAMSLSPDKLTQPEDNWNIANLEVKNWNDHYSGLSWLTKKPIPYHSAGWFPIVGSIIVGLFALNSFLTAITKDNT